MSRNISEQFGVIYCRANLAELSIAIEAQFCFMLVACVTFDGDDDC